MQIPWGRLSFLRDRARARLARRAPTPGRVVIVGGGIAGLTAARRLLRLGHQVMVLEAERQPGGRAKTLRDFDLPGDAGGFRFREDHHFVRSYAKRLGLKVTPFYPKSGNSVISIDGKRIVRNAARRIEVDSLPIALSPTQRWMFEQEGRFRMWRFAAGADTLPRALAGTLKGVLRCGAPVTAIEQDKHGVRVTFSEGSGRHTLAADHAICTVPFPVLRDVSIEPPLSTAKMDAVEALPYAWACLTYFEIPQAFLAGQNLNGFAVTDTVGEVWNLTHWREGEKALLVAYSRDELARSLAALEPDARTRETARRLNEIFPGFSSAFESAVSFCWNHQPWSRGAQSLVWDIEADPAIIRKPEGRIHFAGEHAARWQPGWMDGAIESGLDTALAIHQQLL